MDGASDMHSFASLIHELAHVRFESFMKVNIDQIATKFPTTYIKKGLNGRYQFREDLYNYLTERFAHESEFQTVSSFNTNNYFTQIAEKWKAVADKKPVEIRNQIASHVRNSYEIDDPLIANLDDRSLSDILLNGM